MGERWLRDWRNGGACVRCRHTLGNNHTVNKLTGFEWFSLAVATVGVIGGFVALAYLAGSI